MIDILKQKVILSMDFDWVAVRSKCVLATLFETLKLELKEDTAKRNSIRPNGSDHQFSVSMTNGFVSVALVKWPGGTAIQIGRAHV